MPSTNDGPLNDPGYLGGNLLVSPAAAIPEPSSTGLMVLGVLVILTGALGRAQALRGLKSTLLGAPRAVKSFTLSARTSNRLY